MKKLLVSLTFSLAALVMFVHDASATHMMGGNITYQCVGQDSFLIRLSLYRDCTGAGLGATMTVSITSPTCGNLPNVTLTRIPGSGNDITPLCPGWPSPCNGSSTVLPVGVEEHIYEALVVFPSSPTPPYPCNNWILGYSLCCRNSDITTGAANQNFYISTQMNQALQPCNNSPQFLNVPVPYICAGQPFNYNHGVFDPDGDSLSFSLVACKSGVSSNVSYNAGLSYSQPLHTNGPVVVDPLTGTITFTPSQAQVGVLCVKVDEYRNGVKIGEVTRDIQIIVITCNNPPPLASGIDSSWTNYDTAICPGQAVSFNVYSRDPNPFQSVNMSWNQGIPSASFTTTTGQYPVGTFSWTPTINDVGFHFFTVTVQDDGCPIVSTNIFSYTIHVRNPQIDVGPDKTVCDGDSVTVFPTHVIDFNSFTWIPATGITNPAVKNATFHPSVTTTYTLTASNGFCSAQDVITINVDQKPTLSTSPDDDVCIGESAQITASGNASTYTWTGGATLDDPNIPNPTATPIITTIYIVTATSSLGCKSKDSVTITVNPLPTIDAGQDTAICIGDNALLQATGSGNQYSWEPANLVQVDNSPTTLAYPTSTQIFTVLTIDANGCENTDMVTVLINPLPPVSIDPSPDTSIEFGSSIDLYGIIGASTYLWTPATGIVPPSTVNDQTITVAPEQTTVYYLTVTDANGCRSMDSVVVLLEEGFIEIPNAFNPTSNIESNKTIYVLNTGAVEIEFFRIYNRWGQLLYETNQVGQGSGWDGTFKGELQPAGVYAYVVKGVSVLDGESYIKKGNVTLIR